MSAARLVGAAALAFCLVSRADIAPVRSLGGTLGLTSTVTLVRMADETVRIRLDPARSRYHVEVEFVFQNPGWRDEQLACRFPLTGESADIHAFRVYQPRPWWFDRELRWERKVIRTAHADVWITYGGEVTTNRYVLQETWAQFPLRFPAHADTRVTVRYEQVLGANDGVRYIVRTGAGWAGPIGRATVIVEAPNAAIADALVAPSAWGRGMVTGAARVWRRERFEPTDNDDFEFRLPDLWPQPDPRDLKGLEPL